MDPHTLIDSLTQCLRAVSQELPMHTQEGPLGEQINSALHAAHTYRMQPPETLGLAAREDLVTALADFHAELEHAVEALYDALSNSWMGVVTAKEAYNEAIAKANHAEERIRQ